MSVIIKPPYWMRLNKGHPLTRDLVGCWLMNEATGDKTHNIADIAGQTDATLQGNSAWSAGKYGSCLDFPGNTDYAKVIQNEILENFTSLTLFAIINPTGEPGANWGRIVHKANGTTSDDYALSYVLGSYRVGFRIRTNTGVTTTYSDSSISPNTGWHQAVGVWDGNYMRTYIDGMLDATPTSKSGTLVDANGDLGIGRHVLSTTRDFTGMIGCVMIFGRALSAQEITWLYQEPFRMFERAIKAELICAPAAEVYLAGSITAQSTASATLELIRIGPKIEIDWLADALFNGMTANAFKLGITLTLGWFWTRVAGCTALYRGPSVEQIDFTNILTVIEQDACEISPPSYIPHNPSSTYFYVVRRFNNCGYQEQSLTAAVGVTIDSNGDLAKPQPNKVFAAKAEQVDGNKIRLVWFYCPIEQQTPPVCFSVYHDGRTGYIDYDNPIATIDYQGRKFYNYQTGQLNPGRYLFAIRAKDADGIENSTLAQLSIQIDNANPEPSEILNAASF